MSITEQHECVYVYIGQRIRERRKLLNLSQAELSELMGFSYQQMQKYETGASRVSAGKLLAFAKILNVPASYFYEGLKLEEQIGARIESNIIQRIRTRALRILLVEDNPADVLLFKKALNERAELTNANVLHDAETVMDYLQNHAAKFGKAQPDIVVLDLSLPKLNGMELLKLIKKHPKTMEFPVLVLTNSINVKDMVAAYRNGAAGFIQKSVDLEAYKEDLASVVKYWSRTVALPC